MEMQGNLFSEPVHFTRIERLLNYKGRWLDRRQTAA
jgi:hypothetical protein